MTFNLLPNIKLIKCKLFKLCLLIYIFIKTKFRVELEPIELEPIFLAFSKLDFELFISSLKHRKIQEEIEKFQTLNNKEEYFIKGFCDVCKSNTFFLVDMSSGGYFKDNKYSHNFRERLVCPKCNLNSRQRLIATLTEQIIKDKKNKIYLMEKVTYFFSFVLQRFKNSEIIGSEYISPMHKGGVTYNGIRHEDCESLSFDDHSLDLIVSNDVFEHIPNPELAFKECFRTLKKQGQLLFTIPFYAQNSSSELRSTLKNGEIIYIKPPQYHGNPMSKDGSLVFTDFGWDILDTLKNIGFCTSRVEIYWSFERGHLIPQLIFRCIK
jgi:hypothetical protein